MISAMPTVKYFSHAYVFVDRTAHLSYDRSLPIKNCDLFIEAANRERERVLTDT